MRSIPPPAGRGWWQSAACRGAVLASCQLGGAAADRKRALVHRRRGALNPTRCEARAVARSFFPNCRDRTRSDLDGAACVTMCWRCGRNIPFTTPAERSESRRLAPAPTNAAIERTASGRQAPDDARTRRGAARARRRRSGARAPPARSGPPHSNSRRASIPSPGPSSGAGALAPPARPQRRRCRRGVSCRRRSGDRRRQPSCAVLRQHLAVLAIQQLIGDPRSLAEWCDDCLNSSAGHRIAVTHPSWPCVLRSSE